MVALCAEELMNWVNAACGVAWPRKMFSLGMPTKSIMPCSTSKNKKLSPLGR